jgi:hypothetical protein
LAFHDRHTGAFSWAMPISTTRPEPPASAAASISGRAMASLLSPFPKWITGMSLASAKRCTCRTYSAPILPNADEDGIG